MISELLDRLRAAAPPVSPAPELTAALDQWLAGSAARGWVICDDAHGFWAHFTARPSNRTVAWVPLVEGSLLGLPRGVAGAAAMALGLPFYRHGPAFWDDLRHWLSPPPPDSDPDSDPERFLLVFDGQTSDVAPGAELGAAPLDPNLALVVSGPEGATGEEPTWPLAGAPLAVELPAYDPEERASLDLLASPSRPLIDQLCSKEWLRARLASAPDGALFDLMAVRHAIYDRLVATPDETASLLYTWTRAALLEGSVLDRIGATLPCLAPPLGWADPRAAAALRGYDLRRPRAAPPTPPPVTEDEARRQLEALGDTPLPHYRITGAWGAAGRHPGLRPQAEALIAGQSPDTGAWLVIENPEGSLRLLGEAAVERLGTQADDPVLGVRALCAALQHLPAPQAAEWAKLAYARWSGAETMAIVAALPWLDRQDQVRVLRTRYEVTERWSLSNDRGAATLEMLLRQDHPHWSAMLGQDALPHLERAVTDVAAELDAP